MFSFCRTQVITSAMGELLDINLTAVKMVMDLMQIDDQLICMEKVRVMFDEYKACIREESGGNNA